MKKSYLNKLIRIIFAREQKLTTAILCILLFIATGCGNQNIFDENVYHHATSYRILYISLEYV